MKTVRIGVDARELCGQPAGKGQYLERTVCCWLNEPTVGVFLYMQPQQELPPELQKMVDQAGGKTIQVAGRGPLWHKAVAKQATQDQCTFFFAALSYFSAIFNKVPTITVVHDLAVFRLPKLRHNRKSFIIERLTLKRAVRRSAFVVAVSESTKRDLLEIITKDTAKIKVILEAPLLMQKGEEPLARAERKPFFLFVGTLEPRKNIRTMLEAYAALPSGIREHYTLKLAGKKGWGGEDYPGYAQELGIQSSVEFLGYVTTENIYQLYREATLFLYFSLYEGFGLPVVEAMAAGTPAITSNVSSLPEAVGEAGYTCSPDDVAGFTAAMEKLLTDTALYDHFITEGYHQAKKFSWEKGSQEILALVKELPS